MKKIKKYYFPLDVQEEIVYLILYYRPIANYAEIKNISETESSPTTSVDNYFFIDINEDEEIKWYKD